MSLSDLARYRALLGNNIIQIQGPTGPTGSGGAGGAGGSDGTFTTSFADIWQGSAPTTVTEAIDRLAYNLYARNYVYPPVNGIPVILNTSKIVTEFRNTGGSDVFIVKYNTSGTPQWIRRIGGTGTEQGLGISSDSTGNFYVTGYYSGTATVFDADGGSTFASLANAGATDIFIVKYNTSGAPQWVRRIGGTSSDQGKGISSDSNGNVYVTGYYSGTTTVFDADGSSTFASLANAGASDVFIVKYNTSGAPQWVRRIGGTSIDQGLGISSDSTGNVYVTGYYTGSAIVFDNDGTSTFASLANAGTNDAFIAKYDTSGAPQWVRRIGGTSSDIGQGISSDSTGNVYVTGYYSGTTTVFDTDGSTTFASLANAGNSDVFIVKYNTSGAPQWVRRIGGTSDDNGLGISSDSTGNVYVTGYFTTTATVFDANGSSTFVSLANPSSTYDVFIVKYDTSGAPQWIRRIGGTSIDQGKGISSDSIGNVYVAGYFNATATVFDTDGSTTFASLANAANGTSDAFIAKYNTSGVPQWAAVCNGLFDDLGMGVTADPTGNVYMTGYYTSAIVARSPGL